MKTLKKKIISLVLTLVFLMSVFTPLTVCAEDVIIDTLRIDFTTENAHPAAVAYELTKELRKLDGENISNGTEDVAYCMNVYLWSYTEPNRGGTAKQIESEDTDFLDPDLYYYVNFEISANDGFDFKHDGTSFDTTSLTTVVNGHEMTGIADDSYNEYWKVIDLYIPIEINTVEYNVTVTGGTASVGAGTPITKATMGTTVTLIAGQAPAGQEFDKWVVNGVVVADANSATTTFVMPAGNVTAEATYKDIPVVTYTVTFDANGGSGTMVGDTVEENGKFTLDDCTYIAPEGYKFKAWAIGSVNGEQKQPGEQITITGETYIYAIWEAIEHNVPVASWKQDATGWWYDFGDGTYAIGWEQIDGTWYYFDSSGFMQTGWQLIGGTWYYFASSGAMQTGWLNDGGTWYYFHSSGAMATGWVVEGGTWYYFASSGAMQTGWLNDGGTWYYFHSSGAMATGWVAVGGTWYYFASSGAMQTGWLNDGGSWYYLAPSGAMATGWVTVGGTWYYFASSGAMQTGWLNDGGSWYYLAPSGAMQTGWVYDGGAWYFMNSSGVWVQ